MEALQRHGWPGISSTGCGEPGFGLRAQSSMDCSNAWFFLPRCGTKRGSCNCSEPHHCFWVQGGRAVLHTWQLAPPCKRQPNWTPRARVRHSLARAHLPTTSSSARTCLQLPCSMPARTQAVLLWADATMPPPSPVGRAGMQQGVGRAMEQTLGSGCCWGGSGGWIVQRVGEGQVSGSGGAGSHGTVLNLRTGGFPLHCSLCTVERGLGPHAAIPVPREPGSCQRVRSRKACVLARLLGLCFPAAVLLPHLLLWGCWL